MHKTSKIYIAGHTGMVGSAIIRKLKEEGFEYSDYDIFDPSLDPEKPQVHLDLHSLGKGVLAPRVSPMGAVSSKSNYESAKTLPNPLTSHFTNPLKHSRTLAEFYESADGIR